MFRKLTEMARAPSAESIARLELVEAKRSLLAAQSSLEYSAAMVGYHTKRVQRLGQFTGGAHNGQV